MIFFNNFISIYKIGFIIIILYLICKFCKKKIDDFTSNKNSKFKLDITEYEQDVNYNLIKPEEYTYLFWNGGYSSTFRLCQLLLLDEKPVQTIYINCCNATQNILKNEMELRTIKEIRNLIFNKYPFIKTKFPPVMYVNSIKKNVKITNNFNKLHNDYGMFEFNSNKDIYENIARFSYDWEYPIEIGISKDEYHMNNAIINYLEEFNFMKHKKIKENVLKNNNTEYNKILTMLDIFKNIIFPIISLSNNELKIIALKKNYFYILQKTWSCNNPTSFKHKCGECSKCIKLPTIIP